jgi:hypothetical protein
MKTIMVGVVAVLTLAPGGPALAQSPGLGGIFKDALGGLLGRPAAVEDQSWRGHFVQAKGTTMIFRAEDGKTYAVDMSAINTQTWHPLTLGQPVTLAAKPGSGSQTLIAARIEAEQQDRSGRLREPRLFRTAHGVVERVEGSQLTVRTTDNALFPVDVAQMTAEAEFRAHDGALVILEPGQSNTVVWIAREDRRDGGGLDILSGLPAEYRRLHGYRVHGSGATMIVLADDGTTSPVDMSAIGTQVKNPLELGQAMALAVKPGREPNSFIAGRIQLDPADPSTGKIARRPFDSVQGTVEAIQGSTITFRTSEGRLLQTDASQMLGAAAIRVNDRGALTYERGPKQITALWLERQEIQPSAAVAPKAVSAGEYQRIHGYVQSVEWATMSLKADDGRTLTVDTSQIDSQMRTTMRPGELVTVLGKTSPGVDQFMAERIERDPRR